MDRSEEIKGEDLSSLFMLGGAIGIGYYLFSKLKEKPEKEPISISVKVEYR